MHIQFIPFCGQHPTKVIFHPYRTARAFPIIAEFAYNHGDEVDQFQNSLNEMAVDEDGDKAHRDNHTVYEVFYKDSSVCFWFSDWKLRIGLKLYEEFFMSNTPKVAYNLINRSNWAVGEWDNEPDRVEWVDELTGYNCLAKRGDHGSWCGYVGIGPDNPNYGVDYFGIDADVHGGITYGSMCQDDERPIEERICHIPKPGEPEHLYWVGFDCCHGMDRTPMLESNSRWSARGDRPVYRNLEYVKNEITELAKQLKYGMAD